MLLVIALAAFIAEIVIDTTSTGWVLLVSLVIPIVVELLAKARASKRVKGVLALVASALVSLVDLVAGSGGVVATDALQTFGIVFLIQLAAYLGVYKPLGLPGSIAPDAGFGAPKG